ncbi:uncharacterized protein LOC118197388 isoform X1 [Stegodyphus dumicola]|uniref:uncharacterized protein LOC118197388 isoform X1 n=1 Tax=Stegodyphus dumicola TaxID=202533 RepID=UPI0015A8AEC2|nr:uncharacterized protein LOC118197388 isoform X1 [Stegodyphus dumicola]
MAIEYYKEHIEPTIPEMAFYTSDSSSLSSVSETESSASDLVVAVTPIEISFQALKRFSTIKEIVNRNREDISTLKHSAELVRKKVNSLETAVQQLKLQQKSTEETVLPDNCKINEILVQLNLCKHQIELLTSQLPESQSTNNTSAMVSKTSNYSLMNSYCSRNNKNQHIVKQNEQNRESDYLASGVKFKLEEMLKKKKSGVVKKYSLRKMSHERKRASDHTEAINFKQKKKKAI